MKKLIKSFKQAIFVEANVSNKQQEVQEVQEVQPQAASNSNSEKREETAISAPIADKQNQNNSQSVKPKVRLAPIQSEEAVQADKTKFSSQRQLHNNGCRLFLGGLPDNITEAELKKVFESYGKVIDMVIPFDRETNKRKRYGYLEFESEDSAKACLLDHFLTIGGRRVEIKQAWPRGNTKKENCEKKETKEMGTCEKFVFRPGAIESSSESSCSDSESNGPPLYQKLFEDYFKAKFFLQNLIGPETVPDKILNEEIKKKELENEKNIEKILRGLYITAKGDSSEEEDSGDFTGDTDDGTHSTVDELEYYSFRGDSGGASTASDQTENFPLPTKDAERRVCNLCKWAPLDNSAEGFLAHCKTLAHKQKLKERFKKNAAPNNPQKKAATLAKPGNDDGKNKQHCKMKHKRWGKKLASKTQNNKNEGKLVLEEIRSSFEASTEKCLKCNMCNKTIPKAVDVRGLMANLSHHLQSKGHLARISGLEKSLGKWENVSGKKTEVKMDILKNEKTTPGEKKHKHSKYAPNNKNLSENSIPKVENSTKTKGLLFKNENVPQSHTSTSTTKIRFHCLLCSYFCSQPKKFLTHLHSESHFANDKETSRSSLKIPSLESLWSNSINCSHCNTYLYGHSDSIKNHFTKCRKPKQPYETRY